MTNKAPNPNNCDMCEHKQNPDGGWCYMFSDEPKEVCMQHTMRRELTPEVHLLALLRMVRA